MTAPFFQRLNAYYQSVAAVLRGDASIASIFPNTTDIGISREAAYLRFLTQHVPKKCDVFMGGFLFGDDGSESKQLDVIVTTDTCPRYDFMNGLSGGKSFAPVEGTLAVVSIKSMLNQEGIRDALSGIASIPPTLPLTPDRVVSVVEIVDYDNWPLKVVYASDGVSVDTALDHVNAFYSENPSIPINRRPDVIHVIGKYMLAKSRRGTSTSIDFSSGERQAVPFGEYMIATAKPDVQALSLVVDEIQGYAISSTFINYSYWDITNKISQH